MVRLYNCLLISLLIMMLMPVKAFSEFSKPDTSSVNIYVNKKAGKTSYYSMNYNLPDNYIKGSLNVSAIGPIVYSQKTKDNNSLSGQVSADLAKVPAKGLSAIGWLVADYDIATRGNGNSETEHITTRIKFNVYSMKLHMKDTMAVCEATEFNIPCIATPPGGGYYWSVSGNITLLSRPEERVPRIVTTGHGSGIASVTYTADGVSCSSSTLVLNIDKPVIIVPDTFTVYSGNIFTIKPKFYPEAGDCEWMVKEPLKLYGDNLNYGSATIYAKSAGTTSVSILYKSCTQVSKKTVVVVVKNSQDLANSKYNPSSNTIPGPVGVKYKGYYGYGYYGYNYYYGQPSNNTDVNVSGKYTTHKKGSKLDLSKPTMIENNIILPDSIILTAGEKTEVKPFIAPPGGSFSWEAAGGISIKWAALKPSAYIEGLEEGTSYAKVTYTDGNKVITRKIKIIVKGDK